MLIAPRATENKEFVTVRMAHREKKVGVWKKEVAL